MTQLQRVSLVQPCRLLHQPCVEFNTLMTIESTYYIPHCINDSAATGKQGYIKAWLMKYYIEMNKLMGTSHELFCRLNKNINEMQSQLLLEYFPFTTEYVP